MLLTITAILKWYLLGHDAIEQLHEFIFLSSMTHSSICLSVHLSIHISKKIIQVLCSFSGIKRCLESAVKHPILAGIILISVIVTVKKRNQTTQGWVMCSSQEESNYILWMALLQSRKARLVTWISLYFMSCLKKGLSETIKPRADPTVLLLGKDPKPWIFR